MISARIAVIAALVLPAVTDASVISTLDQITSAYGLNEHYAYTFPSQTLDSSGAASYIVSNWDLNSHGIMFGSSDIAFVSDPASTQAKRADNDAESSSSSSASHTSKSKKSSSTSAPASASTSVAASAAAASSSSNSTSGNTVLRITYPQGSYNGGTGGTQFTSQPLNASSTSSSPFANVSSSGQFERMLLSYDIFFPSGYQFNLGGKLPGLRGGPDPTGCSGGHQSDGKQCFSTRLMWRSGSLGEVYAYLPPAWKGFCQTEYITCNSDYGTSLGRSTFSFVTGKWQTVWLYVELNEVGWRNGLVSLWYNGVQAMNIQNLELRVSNNIDSIAGLFFSTFFGGDEATWASPATQYSYFRNMELYAGIGASNATGPRSAAPSSIQSPSIALLAVALSSIFAAAAGFL